MLDTTTMSPGTIQHQPQQPTATDRMSVPGPCIGRPATTARQIVPAALMEFVSG